MRRRRSKTSPYTCSKCGARGHNKASCERLRVVRENYEKWEKEKIACAKIDAHVQQSQKDGHEY